MASVPCYVADFPFGDVRAIDLHVTSRVSLPWSAAVLAAIKFPPPLGAVLVAHHKPTYELGHGRERELQAVACARSIERYVGDRELHVIVLGDFDDTPDSASVRFWTGRQSLDGFSVAYRDAWEYVNGTDPGHTFAAENPLVRAGEMSLELGRRIDYVLVRAASTDPASMSRSAGGYSISPSTARGPATTTPYSPDSRYPIIRPAVGDREAEGRTARREPGTYFVA
jgi:hypothetical protein